MQVYIANLGRQNYLWPACLARKTIATYEDEDLRPSWLANDRNAYIEICFKKKTAAGRTPTRSVASRWFNIGITISTTSGDLWIHREKDEIWWTKSLPGEPDVFLTRSHPGTTQSANVYQIHKPCTGWSNTDLRGRVLTWQALHPKAREFLFTEGTLQQLSPANAEYAEALIAGSGLEVWHQQPSWQVALSSKRGGVVNVLTAKERSALRMAMVALATTRAADGREKTVTGKIKEFRFESELELRTFVEGLIADQEGFCALTGLSLLMDGEPGDPELICSLDRIDSDGHYERGNLQIVCKFANRWKAADDNNGFLRLIGVLQAVP